MGPISPGGEETGPDERTMRVGSSTLISVEKTAGSPRLVVDTTLSYQIEFAGAEAR